MESSKFVSGMSWKEPYVALGVAALWGVYGAFYFISSSKKKGREILLAPNGAKPGMAV